MDGKVFYEFLRERGYEYFVGVPDSLLNSWLAWVADNASKEEFQIATNEGEALSLAAGYHLATGRKPVVFLQNSGLGNLINPLMSLVHRDVYDIPLLLIIGWRGAPGIKDEPQHMTMGQVTKPILEACGIPSYDIGSEDDWNQYIESNDHEIRQSALLIKSGVLSGREERRESQEYPKRIHYLEALLARAPVATKFFATTGYTSRELWALQSEKKTHSCFYNVGAMGFVSAVALGHAQAQRQGLTCVIDGDGALLMHMGNMASIGTSKPEKFVHIVLRNNAHESTGAQALAASPKSFAAVASALGYRSIAETHTLDEFISQILALDTLDSPAFIEAWIRIGSLDKLPRPTGTPKEWKEDFWGPQL